MSKNILKYWSIKGSKLNNCGLSNHGATSHIFYRSLTYVLHDPPLQHTKSASHGQFQVKAKNSATQLNIFFRKNFRRKMTKVMVNRIIFWQIFKINSFRRIGSYKKPTLVFTFSFLMITTSVHFFTNLFPRILFYAMSEQSKTSKTSQSKFSKALHRVPPTIFLVL